MAAGDCQGGPVPKSAAGPKVCWRGRRAWGTNRPRTRRCSKVSDLRQKELIALGLLAQQSSLTALEFSRLLALEDHAERLRDWLGRLLEWGLVKASGRTRAREYQVEAAVIRELGHEGRTTLKAIEPHRLQHLVLEDLRRHPQSAIGDIHRRIGVEIARHKVKRTLRSLVEAGLICRAGRARAAVYAIAPAAGK